MAGGAPRVSAEAIWLDGEMIPFADAKVHVLTHTLHYGLGVFEGIRCYRTADGGSAVFRLREHVKRLLESAHINLMQVPYDAATIEGAILDTLRANHLAEGYIRPLIFIGDGVMGLHPADNAIRLAIICWPWGKYLGEEGMERGIRTKISTFTRHHVNAKMTKGKTCGDYVNSILAKREVTRQGYDEAIMLDTNGLVAECSGENIFAVRRGVLKTPPLVSVLEGITRDSVIRIARDKGIEVVETSMTRDELYCADEVFLTGTAAELTPVREIDDRQVGAGSRGPITKTIQSTFFDAVHGRDRKYDSWLSPV